VSRSRSGVTVLELIVVIAIVSVLMALLLPAVQSVRECARNQQCIQRFHQVGLALHNYHDVHCSLPPGWRLDNEGRTAFAWGTLLLPFIEQQSLYRKINLSNSAASPPNRWVADVTLPIYVCPSDHGPQKFALFAENGHHESAQPDSREIVAMLPRANYVAIFGSSDPDDSPGDRGEGAFVENRGVRFGEVVRGLSQIVLVGERTTRKLPSSWYGFILAGEDAPGRVTGHLYRGPNRGDADECELDSRHPEHVNFVWGDGHATSVSNHVDVDVYH